MMSLGTQLVWLLVLAGPVAAVAWTLTHEEVFREVRDWCVRRSRHGSSLAERKFFYLFTCEFCFSHWVALFFLAITDFQLLYSGWRGSLIAFFSLVWLANIYMNLYGVVRLDIRKDRVEIQKAEQEAKQVALRVEKVPTIEKAG
jgi:hypothetical protein